jgi:hypothetical protein
LNFREERNNKIHKKEGSDNKDISQPKFPFSKPQPKIGIGSPIPQKGRGSNMPP